MSGESAYVFTKPGVKLTRTVVRKALEGKGLKLEGLKAEEIVRPTSGYQLAVKGGG